MTVDLDYRLSGRVVDQLELRPSVVKDPYRNCASGGYSFPHLITTKRGAPVSLGLPREEL